MDLYDIEITFWDAAVDNKAIAGLLKVCDRDFLDDDAKWLKDKSPEFYKGMLAGMEYCIQLNLKRLEERLNNDAVHALIVQFYANILHVLKEKINSRYEP